MRATFGRRQVLLVSIIILAGVLSLTVRGVSKSERADPADRGPSVATQVEYAVKPSGTHVSTADYARKSAGTWAEYAIKPSVTHVPKP